MTTLNAMRWMGRLVLFSTMASVVLAQAQKRIDLDRKPDVAYGDFQKSAAVVESGGLHLRGSKNQGGVIFNGALDLSALATQVPVLYVKTGAENKAARLSVLFKDAAGASATFRFTLPSAGDTFCAVPADQSPKLAEPAREKGDGRPLELAAIRSMQVIGDWQGQRLDTTVSRLEFIPPTPAMLAEAAKRKAREEKARARLAEEETRLSSRKTELLRACPHPADGPEITAIGLVAADILGVTIQEGRIKLAAVRAYNPATDSPAPPKNMDKRAPKTNAGNNNKKSGKDAKKLFMERGGRLEALSEPQPLSGVVGGVRQKIGTPSLDGRWFKPGERGEGTPLETAALEEPAAYEISSGDDVRYSTPLTPLAVYRKSKPNGPTDVAGVVPVLHHIYLKLPHSPREGATYTVRFKALNTREETRAWKHDSRSVLSEALHVNALDC